MKALNPAPLLLTTLLLLTTNPSDARLSRSRDLESACPEDAKECPDGTVLTRDVSNDCKFPECPEARIYTAVERPGTLMPSASPVENVQVFKAATKPDPIAMAKPLKVDTVGPMPTESLPPIPFVKKLDTVGPMPSKTLPPLDVQKVPLEPKPAPTAPAMPTKSLKLIESIACLGLSKLCWDGSKVSPDPFNGCKTPACPPKCCDPYIQLRCGNGPPACCDDGNWVCPQEDGTYSCQDKETKEPPQGEICEEKACPKIAYLCPNGEAIFPDPDNNCKMPPCPEPEEPCCNPFIMISCAPGSTGTFCCENGQYTCGSPDGTYQCGDEKPTTEPPMGKICGKGPKECLGPAKECEDGSIVGPDPMNGCRVPECPEVLEDACCDPMAQVDCKAEGPFCCEDGTWTCPEPEDGTYQCGNDVLKEPPKGDICEKSPPRGCKGKDIVCDDGTVIYQDPYNDCKYPECPVTLCPAIMSLCPDGSTIQPDPKNDCLMPKCSERCLSSTKTCPDGSIVGRDQDNDCDFLPCQEYEKACPEDEVKICEDGSEVSLDPATDCNDFFPCPEFSCCNPNEEYGMYGNPWCFEGHQCCPDGTWTCSIGDGVTFSCGGELTIGPFPDSCPCCDRSDVPDDCSKPACCDDGTWSCADSDGNYKCGDELFQRPPEGLVCKQDIPIEPQGCTEDAKVCSGGTVLSRDPQLDCEFPPCPDEEEPCCDEANPIYCMIGMPGCCNGDWICTSDADGTLYNCNGEITDTPSGIICGKDEEGCPQDVVEQCPDGTFVELDPSTGCREFYPCPEFSCCNPNDKPTICREGCECCPDGTWAVSRGDASTYPCGGQMYTGPFPEPCPCCDPSEKPDCEKAACCEDGGWSCPDKNGVYICGEDKLDKPPIGIVCKPNRGCPRDLKTCPDGTTVGRDPNNDCEFFPCKPRGCPKDLKTCPDGSLVGRDPNNNCEFLPCKEIQDLGTGGPKQLCGKDLKECRGGSTVGRNVDNDCNFFECPKLSKEERERLKAAERAKRKEELEKFSVEKERIKAQRAAEKAKKEEECRKRKEEKERRKREKQAERERARAEEERAREAKKAAQEKARAERAKRQQEKAAERAKRQEERERMKAEKQARNSVRGKKVASDAEHEQQPRTEDR